MSFIQLTFMYTKYKRVIIVNFSDELPILEHMAKMRSQGNKPESQAAKPREKSRKVNSLYFKMYSWITY